MFVLLAAHAIVPRLRSWSAAQRHLLWAASLATAATLPLLGLVLPLWQPEWAARLADAWPPSLDPLKPWASRPRCRSGHQDDRNRDGVMGRGPMVAATVDGGHRRRAGSADPRRCEAGSPGTRRRAAGRPTIHGGVPDVRARASSVPRTRAPRESARGHADDLGRPPSACAATREGARLARRADSRRAGARARSHRACRLAGAPRCAAGMCDLLVQPAVLDGRARAWPRNRAGC